MVCLDCKHIIEKMIAQNVCSKIFKVYLENEH